MYQALYRKWRPKSFADVVGQGHITHTLQREVAEGRLSHAYLFTGTRGTGKTTCAKILARAVNCENPQDGNPCNACPACLGIENGSILDVLELDAASNNGVDHVRALRDEAIYSPASVRYRVYIVDEVHMLSTPAFNALLKILEEPPAHLIFILATTELHKVPATILSRCQRFAFKRIRPQDIEGRLRFVAEQEGMDLTEEAAGLLSRLADGALRDALSLLDQLLLNGGGAIKVPGPQVGDVYRVFPPLPRQGHRAVRICGRQLAELGGGDDGGAVIHRQGLPFPQAFRHAGGHPQGAHLQPGGIPGNLRAGGPVLEPHQQLNLLGAGIIEGLGAQAQVVPSPLCFNLWGINGPAPLADSDRKAFPFHLLLPQVGGDLVFVLHQDGEAVFLIRPQPPFGDVHPLRSEAQGYLHALLRPIGGHGPQQQCRQTQGKEFLHR